MPGSNLWFHIAFSHHILVFFDLWQFQNLPLFFMILTVLKSQVFCRMGLNLGLPDIFLMIRLGCRFRGKYPAGKDALLITYRGCTISTWFITGDVKLNHLVKAVFARLFYCKFTISPFLCSIFWKQVTKFILCSKGKRIKLWLIIF